MHRIHNVKMLNACIYQEPVCISAWYLFLPSKLNSSAYIRTQNVPFDSTHYCFFGTSLMEHSKTKLKTVET